MEGGVVGVDADRLRHAEGARSPGSSIQNGWLSKEQVLQCMGVPASKAAEGETEVWAYASGNNYTSTFGTTNSTTNISIQPGPYFSTGNAISSCAFAWSRKPLLNGLRHQPAARASMPVIVTALPNMFCTWLAPLTWAAGTSYRHAPCSKA